MAYCWVINVKSLPRKWNSGKFRSHFGWSWRTFRCGLLGWRLTVYWGWWLSLSETKDTCWKCRDGIQLSTSLISERVRSYWGNKQSQALREYAASSCMKTGQTRSDPAELIFWSSANLENFLWRCCPFALANTVATGHPWAPEMWLVRLRNKF